MIKYALVATLVVGLTAPVAQASLVQIGPFTIDEGQVVKPTGEIGTGVGSVTLDTVTLNFSWKVSYQNLTGDLAVAHFHGPALPGQNAGVQVPISGLAPSSGFLAGSAIISPAQAADLQAGLWYVNLHTTLHPGGEIRGQVIPAPMGVALLGVAGLMGTRRRRK